EREISAQKSWPCRGKRGKRLGFEKESGGSVVAGEGDDRFALHGGGDTGEDVGAVFPERDDIAHDIEVQVGALFRS
ncbi:MAG: hypothetical protein ACP5OS_06975, partial [Leptospirillia bacterium]